MKTPPQTPGMTSSMDVYAVYRNALEIDVRCLAGMINERFGVNFPDDSVTQKVERLKAENKLQDPSHKWNYNAVGKFIWNHGVDEEELSLLIALGDEDRDYIKGQSEPPHEGQLSDSDLESLNNPESNPIIKAYRALMRGEKLPS